MVSEFREIKADYVFDPDIFNEEPDRVRLVKYIMAERLSTVDRTIILLYIEYRSYRKLGQRLGVSHMTARREVLRIKRIILEEYAKLMNETK